MVKIEDVKLIKVRVGVRYWEDSEYNGVEDVYRTFINQYSNL